MTTPTFIMAVPWQQQRVKAAAALREATGGTVVWDTNRHATDTWRAVLRATCDLPAIVLEDDVVLTEGWREKIEAAVADRPDDVIQFFSMRGADESRGSRYEPGRTFLMNQCYYLPAGVPDQLLEYAEGWEERHPDYATGYDVVMARWMQETGRRYWLHVPSLVQHRDWRSEINPRRPRNRQSRTFR